MQNVLEWGIDNLRSLLAKQEARLQSSVDQLRDQLTNNKSSHATPLPEWKDMKSVTDRCTAANETATTEIETL